MKLDLLVTLRALGALVRLVCLMSLRLEWLGTFSVRGVLDLLGVLGVLGVPDVLGMPDVLGTFSVHEVLGVPDVLGTFSVLAFGALGVFCTTN